MTRLLMLIVLAVTLATAALKTQPAAANSGNCGGRSYGCPGR
jgi:hypothetical protein